MIFRRAAQRELTHTAITVFVALFAILLTTQLIRLLGEAAGGKIAPDGVLALLGFGAVNYLPTLLSLTMFIAILMTLSRSYRDSEMAIWFSAGVPLTAWVRPVLQFALPLVIAIGALSMFLSPWALAKSAEYRQRMDQRDDTSRVSPGAFQESAQADRVFFVEGQVGDEGRVKNVFISSRQHGRLGVVAAAEGHAELAANGDRFLVLENGRRYEGTPGSADYRVMRFDRYGFRVETRESRGIVPDQKNMPIWDLVAQPTPGNLGELLWRVGIPLSALNLALLAIPLSFVNPRAGRTNNLVFSLLTFMLYSNMISLSQAWVSQGKLPFEIGVWAVHVIMFNGLLVLFYRRLSVFSWGRLWR
ncbi:MAG: LPS export ABC transporter permease LptF [Gammaproteobacteria bacterium]|nr:LPS export ABC transporter permease LptF [Gammaproteobacteria bacterium]MBU1415754.1 LPS export ABC transporter permease LptF [Gammaproteobacteria bacterium]